jgi:cleavage stimulation factor subunit 3
MSDDYDPTAVAFKPGDMETDMNTGEPLALEAEAAAKDPAHNEESGEDTNANVESGTLVHQGDEPESIDKEDKVEDGPDTKSDGGVLDEPKDGEQRDDEKKEEHKPENPSE